jgi:single-strand DNA-binding protein
MWINCRAFYNLAENINASLTKGDRVVIQGKMTQRNYQDQAGNNRFSIDMLVEELGASLRSATVKVTKNQRGDFQGGYNQTGGFKGASNSSFGFQSAETPGGFGAGDSLSGSSQSQFDAVPPPF